MKVLKFGGSSVSEPDRIKKVITILSNYHKKGEDFTVVFSAFGGITDSLISMSSLAALGDESYQNIFEEFRARHLDAAEQLVSPALIEDVRTDLIKNHEVLKNLLHGIFLVREASPRTMDYVLSFGERNSCFIISKALQSSGIDSEYLDARKIIKTNKNFSAASVDFAESYKNIKSHFSSSQKIQIVTGFIGSDKGGLTTTLGRGGSDYTASLLAVGLDAKVIEIWTDVNGVLTADPRKVSKAFTIPKLSYLEAMEMSHFGAKVIYPPTLQPALEAEIPLVIKNTFNPEHAGTHISAQSKKNDHLIKGISSVSNIALITLQGSGLFGVPGISGKLFSSLAAANINVILITQGSSEYSISFAVAPKDANAAESAINDAFAYEIQSKGIDPVKVENDLCVVAIIGENMRYQPGIASRLFQALGKNGINCIAIAQGSSELNVSVVVSKVDEVKALNSLHEGFFLSGSKELHLFMVGVGLIGSTMLKQIKNQADFLLKNYGMTVKVVGLANSKKMHFNKEGIDPLLWKESVDNGAAMTMSEFVKNMIKLNLRNSIFVDNTASKNVSSFYEEILNNSISISTPNKIATSSSVLQYQQLKHIAAKRGVQFHYETNVGAGLPVISTLKDLIVSGDKILKIEGVLSGSLSFIFNSLKPGVKFSDIVKEAQEKGFTEPDPRLDIQGIDVRRKLIILARETGLLLESEDVDIENVLSDDLNNAEDVDSFFELLPSEDDKFAKRVEEAKRNNKLLRMVATLEGNQASIGLKEVKMDHPFATLAGSDNMIIFTTERYKERPLVVRGPGAGAEVTAAGVFAEVIKIGHFLS